MEKKNITEKSLEANESKLLEKLDDLKHLCFGMYAKLIPQGIDKSDSRIVQHVVAGISSEIAKESVDADADPEEHLFYSVFYQMSSYFLLSMCPESDQILLALRKLANTFNTEERIPIEKTVFSVLIGNINLDNLEDDRSYAELCLQCYEEFKTYYNNYMIPSQFRSNVRKGLNRYADICGYSCITNDAKFSETMKIVDDACNYVYFSVYQKWEF